MGLVGLPTLSLIGYLISVGVWNNGVGWYGMAPPVAGNLLAKSVLVWRGFWSSRSARWLPRSQLAP